MWNGVRRNTVDPGAQAYYTHPNLAERVVKVAERYINCVPTVFDAAAQAAGALDPSHSCPLSHTHTHTLGCRTEIVQFPIGMCTPMISPASTGSHLRLFK